MQGNVPTESSHIIYLLYARTINIPIYSSLIIIRGSKLTKLLHQLLWIADSVAWYAMDSLFLLLPPKMLWGLELFNGILLWKHNEQMF